MLPGRGILGQTNRIIDLHGTHGRCIISGDGDPRDEGTAGHVCLQRSVGGRNHGMAHRWHGFGRPLEATCCGKEAAFRSVYATLFGTLKHVASARFVVESCGHIIGDFCFLTPHNHLWVPLTPLLRSRVARP